MPPACSDVFVQTCDAISLTHTWSLSMNNLDEYYIEFQLQTPDTKGIFSDLPKCHEVLQAIPVSKQDCIQSMVENKAFLNLKDFYSVKLTGSLGEVLSV